MPDEHPATCGQGLAANAVLPEKMAALISAMAELLQNHTRSLDGGDANAQPEHDAYERLVSDQRTIASSLGALGSAMRGYHDLPPAPHDMRSNCRSKIGRRFEAFIGAEEDLLALLQESVRSHRAMLSTMGSS